MGVGVGKRGVRLETRCEKETKVAEESADFIVCPETDKGFPKTLDAGSLLRRVVGTGREVRLRSRCQSSGVQSQVTGRLFLLFGSCVIFFCFLFCVGSYTRSVFVRERETSTLNFHHPTYDKDFDNRVETSTSLNTCQLSSLV